MQFDRDERAAGRVESREGETIPCGWSCLTRHTRDTTTHPANGQEEGKLLRYFQSLEFVAETKNLAEMKIENHGTKYFLWEKIDKHTVFPMKIKMMDLWMQIEGRKLMFILNFSVLDFFKVASRMPQTAQILVSTVKIFQGSMPPDPPTYYSSFFL